MVIAKTGIKRRDVDDTLMLRWMRGLTMKYKLTDEHVREVSKSGTNGKEITEKSENSIKKKQT